MLLHPSGCVAIPTRGKRTASSEKSAEQAQKSSSIDVSVCAMVCAFGGKTQLGEGHIVDEEMLCSGGEKGEKSSPPPTIGRSALSLARRCSLAADCLYAPAYSESDGVRGANNIKVLVFVQHGREREREPLPCLPSAHTSHSSVGGHGCLR